MAAAALLLAAGLAGGAPQAVEREAGGAFYFSATVGAGRVLLRWAAMDRPSPYTAFVLRRRAAADADLASIGPVPIQRLTDPAGIDLVFPPGSAILEDIDRFLIPGRGPTPGVALLALRSDPAPAARMQIEMLVSANYGVAIAEGLGFLDETAAPATRYLYELWGVDPAIGLTEPAERLGKAWADTSQPTRIPAPLALVPVTVPREAGHARVFLKWDPTVSPADRETAASGFGFDIYRLAGTNDPDAVIPDPPVPPDDPASGAIKVNSFPVVPNPGSDPAQPDFFFVDQPIGDPDASPPVPPVAVGISYKYWAVARDLLRQHGTFSAPIQTCVPDQRVPRQVRLVKTQMVVDPNPGLSGIRITWEANASDPPAGGDEERYIDDTTAYHVYRLTDHAEVLQTPDPARRIATVAAGTSFLDTLPALPAHESATWWYTVTAVDGALCNRPANESAYSAPARGVFQDIRPPVITGAEPFCDSLQNPRCVRNCASLGGPDPWCGACGSSGLWPVRGDTAAWGFRVRSDQTAADTWSVRIYRGFKEPDFRPISEGQLVPNIGTGVPGFRAAESFAPRMSQKTTYRLRALDKDTNVGPTMEPRGLLGQPLAAFVRGDPPPRPIVIEGTHDPAAGTLTVRWHAPGAEALAGFLVRLGPAGDPDPAVSQYEYFPELPAPNFFSEIHLDPLCPNACDVDHDGRCDLDADGIDPADMLITDNTKQLADLIAVDPALAGAREPATGIFRHTFAGIGADGLAGRVVDVAAVDITGQLSPPARLSSLIADSGVPPWPRRPDPPSGFLLVSYRQPGAGDPEHVELCWDQDAPGPHPAETVAVFRALVENGARRGFQQRSPLLLIDAYNNPPMSCSAGCVQRLNTLMAPDSPTSPVCWEDFGVSTGASYEYVVVGFKGPPQILDDQRNEREVRAVFGPRAVCVAEPCP